uniref:Uncharacterized protein MANES_18G073000 n=1 Tax=Rhizophora mucronata TaxID=61149 RepID=A0A2P2KJP3_RHIMU
MLLEKQMTQHKQRKARASTSTRLLHKESNQYPLF